MDRETFESYLTGANYPATPEQLIDVALGNRAPDEFVDRLRASGEGEFSGLEDVSSRLPDED